jgi:two-component system, NtrC family, response regulator HydG
MRNNLIIVCLLSGLSLPVCGQSTLDDCIRYAWKHNPGFKNVQIDVKEARTDYVAAMGKFLPYVSVQAEVGRHIGRSVDPDTNGYTVDSYNQGTIGMDITLSLFEGFARINRLRYTHWTKKEKEWDHLAKKNDLAYRVAEAYYKAVLASLELLLETEFSEIKTAHHPNQIISIINTSPIDVIILDMNFSAGINNGNEGLYWLKRIREIAPALPVVMLTAYGDVELAVKALKNDATDFLLKPWDNRTLVRKIKDAFGSGKKRKNRIPDRNKSPMIVGTSPAMQQLMKIVVKVARTDANILITGENGTGKEMLAQEIHRLSTRKEHSMVTVDMGAISESLFESELFGHERGSFTDAYESRPGKFEAASGSSLFMDEIGNLPLAMQAKLLTVLQNRKITRIGSNKVIPVDIRLLSATNKNIQDMVDSGTFREDLLYRLNTIHLEIPPLRERREDIHLFINYFMQRYAAKYEKKEIFLHEHALEKLCSYHWPGNIRELQHTIEKAVILCEGDVIRSKDIFVKQTWSPQFSTTVPNLEEVERQAIETAIRQNDGNLTATAEQLGISRQTLYNKIKRFKL